MNQIYACREGKETPSTDAKITSTATTPTRSVSRSIVSKLLLGVFLFLVFGAVKTSAQTRTFTPGVTAFTVPPGVTSINIDAAGAGGGGAASAVVAHSGGGGGGGGFARSTAVAVTSGQQITVTVGSGGVGILQLCLR